jgi:hypothetical protein
MEQPKRKRIGTVGCLPSTVQIGTVDKNTYGANSASTRARKTHVFDETLNIEIWIDEHYQNRVDKGSDDGSKRDGIEYQKIEPLLIKSFKHLLYYSLKHKNFIFINHPPNRVRNIRLVLKELIDKEVFLSVVVEYHYVDFKTIEVTIVTAMLVEDFMLSDGQYGIEFAGNHSTLIQCQSRKVDMVDTFEI